MLRLKNPCGKVDPGTYKCIDDLSQKYGQQDLRATTRQAFQVRCVTRFNYMWFDSIHYQRDWKDVWSPRTQWTATWSPRSFSAPQLARSLRLVTYRIHMWCDYLSPTSFKSHVTYPRAMWDYWQRSFFALFLSAATCESVRWGIWTWKMQWIVEISWINF